MSEAENASADPASSAPEDSKPSTEQAAAASSATISAAPADTAPGPQVSAPEATQPTTEQGAPSSTTAAVPTDPEKPVPTPSEASQIPESSYPLAPQPSAPHPPLGTQQHTQVAPPPPQQQINPSPATQYTHTPTAYTQSPASPLNAAPAQPINNGAFGQQPQQLSHTPMTMGMAPPPAMATPGPTVSQYYPDMSPAAGSPEGYEMVDSSRLLSARSKKDVKRRTKTGCLTCRKRRIKCDERHPVCRNCEKSKRDCLGYDPVFKSQPGASALQPASPQPSAVGAARPQSFNLQPTASNHATPGAASQQSSLPEDNASATSPAQEGVTSPCVQDSSEPELATTMAASIEGADKLELRQVSIEKLLVVRGQLCQPLEPLNTTPARLEDIRHLFFSYAEAIDKFLEVHWFIEKALPHVLANGPLLAQYAALLDGFGDPQIHDPTFLARLESRETRIIWDTMALCRQVYAEAQRSSADGNNAPSIDLDLPRTVNRFTIFEALITGATLSHNPVEHDTVPPPDPTLRLSELGYQIKERELQYWDTMGRFLTVTNDQPDADKTRDSLLLFARCDLDSFENRDIMYSMAIIRNIAKYQPDQLKPLTSSTDEKDASARLYVALKFLEAESTFKGTNQTVKRFTSMVQQHWGPLTYDV